VGPRQDTRHFAPAALSKGGAGRGRTFAHLCALAPATMVATSLVACSARATDANARSTQSYNADFRPARLVALRCHASCRPQLIEEKKQRDFMDILAKASEPTNLDAASLREEVRDSDTPVLDTTLRQASMLQHALYRPHDRPCDFLFCLLRSSCFYSSF